MEKVTTVKQASDLGLTEALRNGYEALDKPFRQPSAKKALVAIFFLFGIFTVWATFMVKDAPAFQKPEEARIFFWHFPCPMLATVLLLQGAWWSFRYLRDERLEWDIKATAALELGSLFALLTMLTGIVFSKAEWGAWWQWDPRQTSFLLVLAVYGAYFVLRGAFGDTDRRAAHAAAYALFATLPAMFLIYIFPRLPQIADQSLHPTQTIMSGDLHGGYARAIWLTLTLTSVLTVWLFRLRVRAGLLLEKAYESRQLEAFGGHTAHSAAVRVVRVSDGSRLEAEKSDSDQ